MEPAGPLMIEHRLIERMIRLLKKEIELIESGKKPDPEFIYCAADFLHGYADRTHHGKEEDILFRELYKKALSDEHKKIMQELLNEHASARSNVKGLLDATDRYATGDEKASSEIREFLRNIVLLYPAHIQKEDKHFFIPVMEYFNEGERSAMLKEFYDFDRIMIHERYRKVVESFE